MKNRMLSLLLAICMVLGLGVPVFAEQASSGSCGENAVWSYENGTLTISGTGSTYDYRELVGDADVQYSRPWDAFRDDIRHVVVGEGIIRLGADAFIQTPNLASVELPGTLKEIGSFAFFCCPALADAQLPEGLTALGQQCFFGTALTEVVIPSTVTFVDANVFEDCKALTDVYFRSDPELPSFVMGNSVFRGCAALEEIQVEEGHLGLRSVGGALYFRWYSGELALNSYPHGKRDTEYRIADNTVFVDQSAFYMQPYVQSIIFPDTVTNVSSLAFRECKALEAVKFEGNAPELQQNAFLGCNITALYPAGDESWDARESWTGEYLVGSSGSITWEAYEPEVAEGVCGDNALWHLENGRLTISGSGEMYDKWTIDNEEWSALRDQITHVVVEEGISYIGSYSFGWCRNLVDVTLSDSVTDIGSAAFFYCEALTSIDLPDSLTSIGDNAFGHSGLEAVELPETVTFLGADAFGNCESLTDVLVLGDPDLPGMTTGNSVFVSCGALEAIRVEEDHPFLRAIDGSLYIEDWDGTLRLNSYPAGREGTLTIPEYTISIEQYALRDAVGLEEVVIPASVTSVGSGAFMDCIDLKRVSFEGTAPVFGGHVFKNCTLTVRHPANDSTWEDRVAWALEGSITWEAYNPANPFTDVPVGAFYEAPVLWAVERGITSGATADTFNPGGDCLRAQVVTFLWRAEGCPEPVSNANPFVDVPEDSFYIDPVLWAVEEGITNGSDATHFNPMGVCNRAQVVTFLYRAMGNPEVTAAECPFTDVEAGLWYEAPILWAVKTGITNGMGDGTFGVNGICNRAQVVTFLYRAYN